jgi:DNA helicase HerA-like ATPase
MDSTFERLGVFYLGREYDAAARRTTDVPLLYDAKDLTTHAVCVGMTGSGKTGLCVALLEEAAIDGIPAIVIDPKGDLSNLALRFPSLDAASLRPWVSEDAARQAGVSADEFAAQEAQRWEKGITDWGQDRARIQRLRDAAEVTIYTPGSDAARSVSVVSSLSAPAAAAGADVLVERASGVASSLLSLLGIDADPVKSREHILLTTILQSEWTAGRSLDLAGLIRFIQEPPVERVGVMELESFFPEKGRFELAMSINHLLAAPRFQAWLAGDPIDIDRMLYGPDAKPRIAVFSIAHLDDAERMFFVSLLLNEVVSWMRVRSGTQSLRVILYMDEIFGFMPPVENPPSKRPFLTLLKQGRAFGLGVVVATQNPVDLDYKALSNAGTWLIGRLQTERDRERLADGLASAALGGLDGAELARTIASLDKRVFLMHNVHESKPVLFQSRWTLSYLAGPMTREQIRGLTQTPSIASITDAPAHRIPAQLAPAVVSATSAAAVRSSVPVLPPGVVQLFATGSGGSAVSAYAPAALGVARVHALLPDGGTHTETVALVAPLAVDSPAPDWSTAAASPEAPTVGEKPVASASFAPLPESVGIEGTITRWEKALVDAVYRTRTVTLYESKKHRLVSRPGESERDFRIRLAETTRASRDGEVDLLRAKYAAKLEAIDERIRRAEHALSRERDQASNQRMQTAVSVGATLLGAFLGRKTISSATLGRATTAMRGAGRAGREQRDVERAEESLDVLRQRRETLASELEREMAELTARLEGGADLVERVVRPRKTDIEIVRVALLWLPVEHG